MAKGRIFCDQQMAVNESDAYLQDGWHDSHRAKVYESMLIT